MPAPLDQSKTKDPGMIKQFTALFNLIMEVTDGVYTVLENYVSKKEAYDKRKEPNPNTGIHMSDSDFRDNLYMSAYIVDNTLADLFYPLLGNIPGTHSCKVQLHPKGEIRLTADALQGIYKSEIKAFTPTVEIREGLYMAQLAITDGLAIGKLATDIGIGIRDIQTKDYQDDHPTPEEL